MLRASDMGEEVDGGGGGSRRGLGGWGGLGGRRGWGVGVVAPFNLSTTHLMAVIGMRGGSKT